MSSWAYRAPSAAFGFQATLEDCYHYATCRVIWKIPVLSQETPVTGRSRGTPLPALPSGSSLEDAPQRARMRLTGPARANRLGASDKQGFLQAISSEGT